MAPDLIHGETFDTKLECIASVLASKKNVLVLVGAGISVSAGVPDFRSVTGLYNTLNYQDLGLACPEDLFDIETFRDNPRPFFKFAKSLYPGSIEPTPSHCFLANLDRRGHLLRIYTQNIDGLEQLSGVGSDKVIYAHGSLSSATCMKCRATYSANDIASDVQLGRVPLCCQPRNKNSNISSVNLKRGAPDTGPFIVKRKSSRVLSTPMSDIVNDNYDQLRKQGLCGGVIKPDVTFFGEKLATHVGRSLQKDVKNADALLVMGTSLSV